MKNKILKSLIIASNPIMFLAVFALRGNKKSFFILTFIAELSFIGMIGICINEQIKKRFEWALTIPMLYIFLMMFWFPIFLKNFKLPTKNGKTQNRNS